MVWLANLHHFSIGGFLLEAKAFWGHPCIAGGFLNGNSKKGPMNMIVHQTFFFFVHQAAGLIRKIRPAWTGQEDHFFRKKMVPTTIGIAKKANPRAIGT